MKTELRTLLVDDERLARKRLRELLSIYDDIRIVGEADSVETAVVLAQNENPDLIFLDVQMPPETGFDLLPRLSRQPFVVFVTAYDNYAVKAFEKHALDYLLKPVEPSRLEDTIRRVKASQAYESPTVANSPGRLEASDLSVLRDKGRVRIVRTGDIAAVEAEGAYTKVHQPGRSPFLLLRSIGDWEQELPECHFVRLDRSLIINLKLIREVSQHTRDESQIFLEGLPAPFTLRRVASSRLREVWKHS